MTEQIFFDTDCLSAFLWVGKDNLILRLYPGRIVLPQQVYDELKKVATLKKRVDELLAQGVISIQQLVIDTPEADLYFKLTTHPDAGYKIIGRGEASAISLVKYRNGILGSNNLRDIRQYIELYRLKYVTTGDIFEEALNQKLISESVGNGIWVDMIRKGRLLPSATFSDYLTRKKGK